MPSKKPRIQGFLDDELYTLFTEYCRSTKLTQSQAIASILKQFFNQTEAPDPDLQSLKSRIELLERWQTNIQSKFDLVDIKVGRFGDRVTKLESCNEEKKESHQIITSDSPDSNFIELKKDSGEKGINVEEVKALTNKIPEKSSASVEQSEADQQSDTEQKTEKDYTSRKGLIPTLKSMLGVSKEQVATINKILKQYVIASFDENKNIIYATKNARKRWEAEIGKAQRYVTKSSVTGALSSYRGKNKNQQFYSLTVEQAFESIGNYSSIENAMIDFLNLESRKNSARKNQAEPMKNIE